MNSIFSYSQDENVKYNNEETEKFDKAVKRFYKNWTGSKNASEEDFLNIIELDLSHKNLTSIPHEVYKCLNLKKIKLSYNRKLEGIPENFYKLKNIEYLDLSFCGLNKISSDIEFLQNLKILNLSTNHLKEVPESLSKLNELKYLNLKKNKISYLPEQFVSLKKLEFLDISYLPIDSVPYWINELKIERFYIEHITRKIDDKEYETQSFDMSVKKSNADIKWPGIENATDFHFSKINKLVFLYYGLYHIPKEVFKCNNLEYINLSHNKIYEIPNSFETLQKLKKLDLSSNKIEIFPIILFKLNSLEFLNIENSGFKISEENFNNFKRPITIVINSNNYSKSELERIENYKYSTVTIKGIYGPIHIILE